MGTDRKVRLVAVDSQKYGSRQLRPGDKFTVPEDDAEDIMALGLGKKDVSREALPISAAKAKQKPVTKQVVKRSYVKSGKYKRKDMRAED